MIDNTLLKWVNAEPIQPTEGSKMLSYSIKAKSGHYLGEIKWNGAIKGYAFYPALSTFYSIDSMLDVIQILHSVKN